MCQKSFANCINLSIILTEFVQKSIHSSSHWEDKV